MVRHSDPPQHSYLGKAAHVMRGHSPAPHKLFFYAVLILLPLESYLNVVEANLSRV